jgi:hypothetical protein
MAILQGQLTLAPHSIQTARIIGRALVPIPNLNFLRVADIILCQHATPLRGGGMSS